MNKYIGSTPVVTQVDGYNRAEANLEFVDVTGDTVTGSLTVDQDLTVDTDTLYVDSSNNRVGIGTSSPEEALHVQERIAIARESGSNAKHIISADQGNLVLSAGYVGDGFSQVDTRISFNTKNTEVARFDLDGNLLVGTTDRNQVVNNGTTGIVLGNDGFIGASRTGSEVMVLDRENSEGGILTFRKDGTTVGSIYTGGVSSGVTSMAIGKGDTSLWFVENKDAIVPFDAGAITSRDNAIDLGLDNVRWDDIYATNGTIQTSDRNEKQDIEALSEAEQRVAVACKGLMRKFRWKSAVEEKGDDARIHFGIIAQDLQDAFAAEGLDAGRYGMFISSTWWEAEETYTDDDGVEQTRTNTYDTQEDAPEGAIERTRMGVRYPELLAFIISAI